MPTYDAGGLIYDVGGLTYDGLAYVQPELVPLLPAAFLQVAFTDTPFAANPTWTTLPGFLRARTSTGRNHALDRMQAGQLTATLNNRDRRYDPSYLDGPFGSNLKPMRQVRLVGGFNLLSPNQSSLEDGTATGWVAGTNATIAAYPLLSCPDGVYALKVRATANGDAYASTTTGTAASPFAAGVPFTVMGSFLAASAGRTVELQVRFYNAAGGFLSSVTTTVVDGSAFWTPAILSGVAPPNTGYAALQVRVVGASAGEVHYGDAFALFCGTNPNPTWARGSLGTMFTGHTESWTVNRSAQTSAETTLVAYDLFKVMSLKKIRDQSYLNALLAQSPDSLWRFNETALAGAATFQPNSVIDHQGVNNAGYNGRIASVAGPLVTDSDPGLTVASDKGNIVASAACALGRSAALSVVFWMKTNARGVQVTNPVPSAFVGSPLVIGANNTGTVGTSFAVWLGSLNTGTASTVLYAVVGDGVHADGIWTGDGVVVNDDQWHLIGITRGVDARTWKIFVDGVRVAQATVASSIFATGATTPASFGIFDASKSPGDIALKDMAIWNSTLVDEPQMAALYAAAILPSETVGSRIGRLAAMLGIPPSWVVADDGPVLQPVTKPLTGTFNLAHAQLCVESDGGDLFVDGAGKLTYYARGKLAPVPSAIFSDTGEVGELPYIPAAGPHLDDLDIYNDFTEQGDSFGPQHGADAASIDEYGPRDRSFSDSQLASPNDAGYKIIHYLTRYAQPVVRVPSVRFTPASSPQEGYTHATARRLLERVAYKQQGASKVGAPFNAPFYIESITRDIDPMKLWEIEFGLSPF